MSRYIIVSDLHIDTWTEEALGSGDRSKSKLQHWCDFLDWCEGQRLDEFIIDGDLMDAPPYIGDGSFTSGIVRDAVMRLLQYAAQHTVTYLYGNHDIGISGLRCVGGNSIGPLQRANLYYPGYVLPTDGSILLLQHGHLYDPALLLYLRDLDVRTYLVSHFQAFEWVQQRLDPTDGTGSPTPGVGSPAMIGLDKEPAHNVYYAIQQQPQASPEDQSAASSFNQVVQQAKQQTIPSSEDKSTVSGLIQSACQTVVDALGDPVKHLIWRQAARSVVDDYLGGADKLDRPVIYCVMGHTHVPDYDEWTIAEKQCVYLNSGTWTGTGASTEDRRHATYLDVDANGKVWVQDWIRDPYTPPSS